MRRPEVGLRVKLFGIVAVTLAIVGGGLWLAAYFYLTGEARTTLKTRLDGLGKGLAAEITDYVLMNDLYAVHAVFSRVKRQNPEIAYVYLLDPGGRVRVHTFEGGFPEGLLAYRSRERLATDHGWVDQRSFPLLNGEAGTLVVGLAEAPAMAGVRRILMGLVLALLLGGALAALVADRMVRAFLAPVEGMVRAVEELEAGGEPEVPIPADELGVLGQALARYSRAARQRARELATLDRLGQRLNRTLDPRRMLEATLATLVETGWFTCAEAVQEGPEGPVPLVRSGCRLAPEDCPALKSLKLDAPPPGYHRLTVPGGPTLVLTGGEASEAFLSAVADYLKSGLERARAYQRLKEKEAERRRLLKALLTAQEEERARIAKDLHDQVGQSLTALRLGLEALSGPPSATEGLKELVEATLADVRRISRELRPAALDELGLEAALRRMVREMAAWGNLESDVYVQTKTPLSPELETVLYRVAQEALTNVVRHARADRVSVLLKEHEGQLQLVIEDDGVGFDPARAGSASNGLIGMRERVELVGGELLVESTPGTGTTVYARVPLPKEVAA